MGKRISAAKPEITVGGIQAKEEDIEHFEVRGDLDQPYLAEISLSNVDRTYSKVNPGGPVEIKIKLEGDPEEKLFKGKVTGVNTVFDLKRAVSIKIWAMDDLHKLSRERRTRTYVKQTVQQIVQKIASENGLSADFGTEPPNLKHEHLFQNNVTDLAYVRWLAARTNREVLVEDNKLLFRKREKDKGPVATLNYTFEGNSGGGGGGGDHDSLDVPSEGSADYLSLMLSDANQVSKVTVRGWDPAKKEAIVGEAQASGSPLGSELGASSAPPLEVFDVPLRTKEEADLIAKSLLEERQMTYIQGHGTTRGNGKIKPGEIVEVKCDDPRFDGKYQVSSVRHSYAHSGGGLGTGSTMGGYRTQFQLKRDAGK
jgi:phage protein D